MEIYIVRSELMRYTVFGITAIAVLAAVFILYVILQWKKRKDWVDAMYFIAVFVTGMVLYALGLSYDGNPNSPVLPLFTIASAIHLSFKSFCGDFALSSISNLSQDNEIFSVAVFMHFITAIMFTCLIAIKLFGKNVINRIHVYINKHFHLKYIVFGKREPVYIVIGISGQAEVFLQSLRYEQKRRTTVILDAAIKGKKNDLIDRGFAVIVIKDDEDKDEEENIVKGTREALEIAGFDGSTIISMSEDDDVNLLTVKIVTDYIDSVVDPQKDSKGRVEKLSPSQKDKLNELQLFVYAMYEMLDRTEHFKFSEYALGRVRFFNPHELRARKFMFEHPITSLIPEEWIYKEKARLYKESDDVPNKPTGPYRIMNFFVGYGRTNQHLLKKSICNYQLLNTDYNALIIDKNAKCLGKHFQNTAPGLFNKNENGKTVFGSELNPGSVYYPNQNEAYNIVFDDLDVLSSDFYDRIIQEIKKGYRDKNGYDFATIIIAIGTDMLNIETALELRQKLYERKLLKVKYGESEYDRVKIFVKISKNILKYDEVLNDKSYIPNKIKTFGALKEILNESYIIDEKMDVIAKSIDNVYQETTGTDTPQKEVLTNWDSLTEFKRESNRYAALSIRTKFNLLGFDFDEFKEANAVEKDYNEKYGIAISERQRSRKMNGEFVDFAECDENGEIKDNARNNLARLEHQRWNTLYLVNGWTKLEIKEAAANIRRIAKDVVDYIRRVDVNISEHERAKKIAQKIFNKSRQDEKSKQHACITSFEGLSLLREDQADALREVEEDVVQLLSRDKLRSIADARCSDFNLMDRLFDRILSESKG
jgi:hypothetical protein